MKSWRRLPSFLERRRFLARRTTSLVSATRVLPSSERFSEGLLRALEVRKLFRATSICSFYNGYSVSGFQAVLI